MQRVSVLMQRYNAVLLHDTLPAPDWTDRRCVFYRSRLVSIVAFKTLTFHKV